MYVSGSQGAKSEPDLSEPRSRTLVNSLRSFVLVGNIVNFTFCYRPGIFYSVFWRPGTLLSISVYWRPGTLFSVYWASRVEGQRSGAPPDLKA